MTLDPSTILADDRLTLMGAPGSPYTRKMLAVLRYRQLPYRLLLGNTASGAGAAGLPQPKVPLLPTFFLKGSAGQLEAVTDSTPLIRRFERDFSGREVVPADPVLALLDALLEDYGDEWLTKAMFHYRWSYPADVAKSAAVLPTWSRPPASDEVLGQAARQFSERQIGRLRYVGSSAATAPIIEAAYGRFLDAFEAHLRGHMFLLGARPGAGDFGLYGQLTQLALFDPTPMALTVARAPRVTGWTARMEDLSGLQPGPGDWFDAAALPATLRPLLAEIGRVYVPVMLANARAVQAGATEVHAQIDGQAWVQQPFPYQAKCVAWLRRDHAALSAAQRARFAEILAGTGCEALFGGD